MKKIEFNVGEPPDETKERLAKLQDSLSAFAEYAHEDYAEREARTWLISIVKDVAYYRPGYLLFRGYTRIAVWLYRRFGQGH